MVVICFVHPIFHFCFLVTFGKNTKTLHNLCLHFTRQDGLDGKKKENHATKVTKIPKTKIPKYGVYWKILKNKITKL